MFYGEYVHKAETLTHKDRRCYSNSVDFLLCKSIVIN